MNTEDDNKKTAADQLNANEALEKAAAEGRVEQMPRGYLFAIRQGMTIFQGLVTKLNNDMALELASHAQGILTNLHKFHDALATATKGREILLDWNPPNKLAGMK